MAKTKTEIESEVSNALTPLLVNPTELPIVKIGLAQPFQIPGYDVFTYVDIVKSSRVDE